MKPLTRVAAATPAPSVVVAALLLALPACSPAPAADASSTATASSTTSTSTALRVDDVPLATGVRLRVTESGGPAGTPVILLHGLSDTRFSWSLVLPLLGPDIRAIVPDQRGHGDSERPASGYAPADLAADVVALMDARGLRRAVVVGHSMGSLVAQQVALRAPERVAALVLVGTARDGRNIAGIDEFAAAVRALEDPVPLEFTRAFQEGAVHHPVPESFIARVSEDSRRLPAHAWREIISGMMELRPATGLRAAGIPTLLLWGERDAMFGRAEQDAMLAMVPGARLVAYPETGHSPHWERPEAVARELAGFVRTHGRR